MLCYPPRAPLYPPEGHWWHRATGTDGETLDAPHRTLQTPPSPGAKGQGQKLMGKTFGICKLCLLPVDAAGELGFPSQLSPCFDGSLQVWTGQRGGWAAFHTAGGGVWCPREDLARRAQPVSPDPALPVLIGGWGCGDSPCSRAAKRKRSTMSSPPECSLGQLHKSHVGDGILLISVLSNKRERLWQPLDCSDGCSGQGAASLVAPRL